MNGRDPFLPKRLAMVETQLRGRGIRDARVLAAMGEVPRHLFLEKALQHQAYDDGPLPIAERQTISQPYIVALTLESLMLRGNEKVLEIGTGSGYQTAILSKLADRVFSVERWPVLGRTAEKRLFEMGCHNVLVRIADGTCGWAEEAPFDAIVVSAAAPSVPDAFTRQLKPGGRLVIPVGTKETQFLYRIRRNADTFQEEKLCACRFVKLVGLYGFSQKKKNSSSE